MSPQFGSTWSTSFRTMVIDLGADLGDIEIAYTGDTLYSHGRPIEVVSDGNGGFIGIIANAPSIPDQDGVSFDVQESVLLPFPEIIFTLQPTDGSVEGYESGNKFTFTLYQALDHTPGGANPEGKNWGLVNGEDGQDKAQFGLDFTVTGIDGDGDTVTGKVHVGIQDDVPTYKIEREGVLSLEAE